MELTKIIELGQKYGVCNPVIEELKLNCNLDFFCKKYFEGSDFTTKKNFPPLEIFQKYKEEILQYGIYVDYKGIATPFENEKGIKRLAVLGNSEVSLYLSDYDTVEIIVKDNAELKIFAKDFSFAMIEKFDNAKVTAYRDQNAKIITK